MSSTVVSIWSILELDGLKFEEVFLFFGQEKHVLDS